MQDTPKTATSLVLTVAPLAETDMRKRCCCNCGHNQRVRNARNERLIDHNECNLDEHRISYVACFEHWCRHWKKE